MTVSGHPTALDELSQRLIRQYWDFSPTAASRIGRHEYDGRLPDLSPSNIRRRIGELRDGIAAVANISAANGEERITHPLLQLFLQRQLFALEELRVLDTSPISQVGYLNLSGYINRDYAPLADRVQSMTTALEQVPDFMETLASYLNDGIGRHVLDASIEAFEGMNNFYFFGEVAGAVRAVPDPALRARFQDAREAAAGAIKLYVAGMRERLANAPDDAPIGPGLFSSMLRLGEAVDLPLSEIVAIGEANLEENLRQLREVAAMIDPARDVREIVAEIAANHPTAESLIPDTRDMLEEIRQSVIDLDLVSIPSEDRCQVVETPTYMRYAFAAMDSAGPLEDKATESFYYVTPVESSWSDRAQEEWLTNFNYSTLRIVSIHEVYPGHFVHALHNRYGQPLPLINRVANSYAFVEGWAHYTEQMMLEEGYGEGRPELQLSQLLEALVRNCRYMCALGLHTGGMTLEDAVRYFMEKAFMEEHPARREALRGTFDPGYLNYTLGKLMILKLRDDCRRERAADFSLKKFHDELLSFGGPPLPLLREVMLEQPAGGPL